MNRKQKLGRRAAIAILACALLTITAAAAAIPTIWEALQTQLGPFAPYAQTIQGAVCRNQGIEVQVLSALSDDLETRVYLSVRDVEGDRLNPHLTLTGKLTTGERQPAEPDGKPAVLYTSGVATRQFKLVSYDPESQTALLSASIEYDDDTQPAETAQLSLTGMTTGQSKVSGTAPCASITGETLKSLPVTEADQIIFNPSEGVNFPYTNAVLPGELVVLAPNQNPMPIEGTDDFWISSMGFASDGRFHIRLAFADGVSVLDEDGDSWFLCTLSKTGKSDKEENAMWERLVPGGVDIILPLYTVEDLESLQNGVMELYGNYTRPGTDIEGSWDIQFPLTYYPSTVLDWTGQLAGRQVRQVTLSPLSVTMNSNDTGAFASPSSTLYAVKRDGTTIAAQPDGGLYSNIGFDTGTTVWDAYNIWQFEEPVDLREVVSLTLLEETIPVN